MLHEPASRATAAECDTTTLALTEDPFADADDMSLADLKKAAAKKPAAKKKTAPKKKITKKKDSKNAKVRSALPQPRGVPPRRRRAADSTVSPRTGPCVRSSTGAQQEGGGGLSQ